MEQEHPLIQAALLHASDQLRFRDAIKDLVEYQGRFPMPIFTLPELPTDQILPALVQVITESTIDDFRSFSRRVLKKNNPFMLAVATMLDHPSPETEQGFNLLTDDLAQFNFSRINPENLNSLWSRTILYNRCHGLIWTRRLIDNGTLEPAAKRYNDIYSSKIAHLISAIQGLSSRELEALVKISDLSVETRRIQEEVYDRDLANQKTAITGERASIPILVLAGKTEKYNAQYQKPAIPEAIQSAWSRLDSTWNWQTTETAVALISKASAEETQDRLHEWITVNNLSGPHRDILRPESTINLDPSGLLYITKNGFSYAGMRNISEGHNMELPFGDVNSNFALRYLPISLYAILKRLNQIGTQKQFYEEVEKTNSLLKDSRDTSIPWLTATLMLFNDPEISADDSGYLKSLITERGNAPIDITEVLLDQDPGQIHLDNKGRLRIIPEDANPYFYLYKSQYISSESKSVDNSKKDGTRTQSNNPEPVPLYKTEESMLVPGFGKVGLLAQEDVKKFLDNISENSEFLDEERLLNDYERFVRNFENKGRQNAKLLFTRELNLSSKRAKELNYLGVEAVYIQDQAVHFIFKDAGINVAFKGVLENNQLQIKGMDRTFIGEPLHILINNIALDLITRGFYKLGQKAELDSEIREPLREIVRLHNRFSTSGLRLAIDNSSYFIPLRLNQFNLDVLVGEG